MISVLIWYLLISLIGLICLPLAMRLFSSLPDRGYSLARPLGLLLSGYLFWLLGSFGVLQNNTGGAVIAILIVAGVNLYLLRGRLAEVRLIFKQQRKFVIIAESLFALAFIAWAFVRSANPEVTYTEKPMELAFLNSILRSPGIPPNDPWLSGYAISYYYFGYMLVSMLIRLSGTSAAIGFNLAVSMLFALTALAAYGVCFNLLAAKRKESADGQRRADNSAAGWALLAPLFILIVSNLAGFLDILHARGVFWTQAADGSLSSNFWKWLAIKELDVPPPQPFGWLPSRGGWMWWRGSRVLQDFNLLSQAEEVIDEFPFFSYLLADLHPHVLGMPFVLLAIGLGLNLYLSGNAGYKSLHFPGRLRSFHFWGAALALGGLAFLNTWDFPIYVILYSAAFTLIGVRVEGWKINRLWDFLGMGITLGVAGFILYLPFYLGFASQAGGLLPSLVYFTRGKYFWVMFAPLLVPIFFWLGYRTVKTARSREIITGLMTSLGVIASLWLLMMIVGGLFQWVALSGQGELASLAQLFFARLGVMGPGMLGEVTLARLQSPVTWLTLLVLIGLTWGLILAFGSQKKEPAADVAPTVSETTSEAGFSGDGFALLLILVGAGLALFPEFFYLRDQFGTRMNTIFKFYFQIWILWGIAAAYGSAVCWRKLRGLSAVIFRPVWTAIFLMALCYPAVMLPYKMGMPGKAVSELTLDGTAYLQKYDADELAAYEWLLTAPYGVVAEAIGGSYNPDFARVSTHTGLPTVQGWGGHEVQWRGGGEELGSREDDIGTLYRTDDWAVAKAIIDRYRIRYIYIGPSEKIAYKVSEGKFDANLVRVYSNPSVVIYEVPQANGLIQVDPNDS